MNCAWRAAAATFAAYLDGADGWLFLDESNDAKPEEMESRWDDVRSRTEEMCLAYYAAEREYTLEKDREMEEGVRATAAKRAVAEGGGGARTAKATMRKVTTCNGCLQNARWRL